MICLNPNCGAALKTYQWGEGYCSPECMRACLDGQRFSEALHGEHGASDLAAELRKDADLADAMHDALAVSPDLPRRLLGWTRDTARIIAFVEAAKIDARLPEIIWQRTKRQTYAEIGNSLGMDASTCNRILQRATWKLLRRCGLTRL